MSVPRVPGHTFTGESEAVGVDRLMLIHGPSFVICEPGGDIGGGPVDGLFVGDARICSGLTLTVEGHRLDLLASVTRSPFAASIVGRTPDRSALVYRDLWVGRGMRMDLRLVNLTPEHLPLEVAVAIEADLADLFAVKEGRADPERSRVARAGEGFLQVTDDTGLRGLLARANGARAECDRFHWSLALEPGGEHRLCLELAAILGGTELVPRHRCGEQTALALPATRHRRWRRGLPSVETDVPGLRVAVERGAEDLGGLRLFDPSRPDEPVIAAGAPWYVTLFGRDSLLTSWMAIPWDPSLALATARVLADLQGKVEVEEIEETPGRILHEVRLSGGSLSLDDGRVYYGSIDATPLFVMLVRELWAWGVAPEELAPLLPAVDAALSWMEGAGDPDGDGYLEYAPTTRHGLRNQGWKDSFDGVSFADGRLPSPPVALAEVQAYAYAAWSAGGELAEAWGDKVETRRRRERAERLRKAFERDFWLEERQAFAIALDRDKRPVDAVASNMGHCLWTGIVADPDMSQAVARWLVSPELFSGWGIRTLATSMARYNPISYHNGSVWPHDTAICAAGLRRAGFADEAVRVATGLLAAAEALDGRLPELFGGSTPEEFPVPIPYPSACWPQAWAAAAPMLLTRALLGLEPNVPAGRVDLDPVLPEGASALRVAGLRLGRARVTVEVRDGTVEMTGLPDGIASHRRTA